MQGGLKRTLEQGLSLARRRSVKVMAWIDFMISVPHAPAWSSLAGWCCGPVHSWIAGKKIPTANDWEV
jgi:hypothetical protein